MWQTESAQSQDATQYTNTKLMSNTRLIKVLKLHMTQTHIYDSVPSPCVRGKHATVLNKNLASAKILKTEFNANLDLLGFPHFIRNAGKCLEMKENDTEELSNSMFLNVITSSFLEIFPKLFREELLGFSSLG